MSNLTSRVVSAAVALTIFATLIYFFKEIGIYAMILFAVVRSSFEVARMTLKKNYPRFVIYSFVFINFVTFLFLTWKKTQEFALFFLLFGFILSVFVGIIFHKKFSSLDAIFQYVSLSAFSLVYTAAIPAMVSWLVASDQGMSWFFCLLAVVFAGDVGAYIFGVNWGSIKVAPTLSPNKSLQGALGGLLFSTLIAYGFSFVLIDVSVITLLLCGFFGGMMGQVGDFFESLIKRVSGVKDSGSIMPGHGGVLDRIDGVLLAAPLFYFAAHYHSLWS